MKGPATISVLMHAALIGLAFVHLGFMNNTERWGDVGSGGGSATPVTLKGGIPLPPAPVESPLATDTKTLNPPEVKEKPSKGEKKPEPPITGKAYEIKSKDDEKKRQREMLMADLKNSRKSPETNAIPGSGARASNPEMSAPVNATAGSDGIGFGGDFGNKYGWYVRTVKECIGRNWDRNRIDTFVRTAPRAYVDFDILRDGSISAEHIATSSGVPAVDREAIRAVQACGGHGPDRFPRLPPDFSSSKVSVEVYFEFKK
jgi:protein TonB